MSPSSSTRGLDAILKKVGEKPPRPCDGPKDGDPKKVVYEVADLVVPQPDRAGALWAQA